MIVSLHLIKIVMKKVGTSYGSVSFAGKNGMDYIVPMMDIRTHALNVIGDQRLRIARGFVEVLECRSCGFLGAADLYHIEDNRTQCPKCAHIYLGYSQVPIKWYAKRQRGIEMASKGFEEISPGMWVRKLEGREK